MDIDAYTQYSRYETYQNRRPDYSEAILNSIEIAVNLLSKEGGVTLCDFCCGVGNNTKSLSHKINNIKKATLIDINSNFLENIDHKDFNIEELELLNEDILGVLLHKESDLIFSIFAYHHVCDDRKLEYIQQIKNALRQGGYLILTEIFSPNKEMTLSYYEKLLDNIAVKDKSVGLQQFLQQTAKSTDFEFKVSKKFSDEQFEQMGFEKIEEIKIWPHDDELGKDIGTFIQVYQL